MNNFEDSTRSHCSTSNSDGQLDLLDLFSGNQPVKICAPMVRYSKLPFRLLVREYGCNVAFTPMIVADAFIKSPQARDVEFTTCENDRPLVVQFAARNAEELAGAAQLVAAHCDGVDLNCGCPQGWAMSEGFGAHLMDNPERVRDMVLQTRNRTDSNSGFYLSTKIRIHDDIRKTVNFCQQAERVGLSWVTVHGRTPEQRNEPVNMEAIKTIRESLSIPVVANGDVKCLDDFEQVTKTTGVKGVMVARGLLQNPALFAGHAATPRDCISRWLTIALTTGTPLTCLLHHLLHMTHKRISDAERKLLACITSVSAILDFFAEHYDIRPQFETRNDSQRDS